MRCLVIVIAVFLLNFVELSLSLLPEATLNEIPFSPGSAKLRAGLVFTDIDYAKLRESLAEVDDAYGELTDEEVTRRFSFTYPSTKWCGPGNTSTNLEDLGSSEEADKCCRSHDTCPGGLKAGGSVDGLINDAFYSRLSCDCDEKFRQCLHEADTDVANHIGTIYFNVIRTKCYRKDYPIKSCKKRGWLLLKCLEYELDQSGTPIYQWFHVPNY